MVFSKVMSVQLGHFAILLSGSTMIGIKRSSIFSVKSVVVVISTFENFIGWSYRSCNEVIPRFFKRNGVVSFLKWSGKMY